MMRAALSHRRVIIVGAGQAGLAVAAALSYEGLRPQRDFVLIDANDTGQRTWGTRWHSMSLLSDARHSVLPPRRFPGDQRRHPRTDEMADYLTMVEGALGVETVWGVKATGVEHLGNGSTLLLSTTEGDVQTRNVVCATGAAACPRLPEWAASLAVPGAAMHSSDYHYPRQLPDGDVLVIGGGNSGVQIARELASSHTVALSVRSPRRHRPTALYPTASGDSRIWPSGKWRREPVFGGGYEELKRQGVTIVPATVAADGPAVMFAGGTQARPMSVIFATGYGPADGWLPSDAESGGKRARSATGLPGLFVAGMPQYGGHGVDTIAGVWRDARRIARYIADRP